MPKARLFFDGDNSGIEKEARIYSLTQEVEDKLDSISNLQDEIDGLQDQINNLASRGRYLSTWDCVTGLPGTDPQVDPYVYRAGDYYIVSNVGGTNLRPAGAEYHVQVPSQVVESQSVSQNDLYIYDGIQWVLQGSGSSLLAVWGSITGTLSAQTDLQNALDAKANKTDVLEKTNTTSYTPTADYHPATKKYADDNDTFIGATAPTNNVIEGRLWYDTTADVLKVYNGSQWVPTGKTYTAGSHIEISNADVISTTGLQEELTAGNNITIEDICTTESDMKGPCPSGFHVPTSGEWQSVINVWTALGGGSSDGTNFGIALKLPFAGMRNRNSTASIANQGTNGYYRASNLFNAFAIMMNFSSSLIEVSNYGYQGRGHSVRAFKNSPVVPDATWTKLYGVSIESGGIFWGATDGLISLSSNGSTWITMQDKNLGATQVWNDGDVLSESNCGGYFQRGNNYMFPYTGNVTVVDFYNDFSGLPSIAGYGPGNYYYSSDFIYTNYSFWGRPETEAQGANLRGGSTQSTWQDCVYNVISAEDTTYTAGNGINIDQNNEISVDTTVVATQTDLNTKQDTLTAGENIQIDTTTGTISATDTTYNAGENITIEDVCTTESDMKGPCPKGFHVPTSGELGSIINIRTALGGGSSDGTNFGIALKLPFAGQRSYYSADVDNQGSGAGYWSSTSDGSNRAYAIEFNSSHIYRQSNYSSRSYGFSVRCFKNSPTVPTSSWTKLYGTSIESGGIFWSSTDGLISLSSDGQTWVTIADKNLGAITVWNSGDTLSESNCGKYYQRGNNYGFPRTGTIANQSTTQVDASTYGPGNYYSSDTFIKYSGRWDTTDNGNLWGGTTQSTWQDCIHNVISAEDTTYTAGNGINIDANNEISNTLPGPIVSSTAPATPSEGDLWYDTTNDVLNTYNGTQWIHTGKKIVAGEGITLGQSGPFGEGYHVPSNTEWNNVADILKTTFGLAAEADTTRDYLKMPTPGAIYCTAGNYVHDSGKGWYWTSSSSDARLADALYSSASFINTTQSFCADGCSLRLFKDLPVVPDNTWTTLYDGSSVATGAGVFHNTTEGLISISGDGITWYTIKDKNEGATTVYNNGDTFSEANCGKWYQWGNCYGFPYALGQTISTTKVDTTGYGPGNYYSSSTFIKTGLTDGQWSTVVNTSLWNVDQSQDVVINSGVLSVNGQTGNVTVTDTTYTAGTGLSLSNGEFSVDTTTIATKADIANLGTFVVVDTLPTAASADEKTIYLLGPIGTGADKYEEWIITRDYDWASSSTLYPFTVNRSTWDGAIFIDSQTSPLSDFRGDCYVGAKLTSIGDETKLPVKLSFRASSSVDSEWVGLNEPAFAYNPDQYPNGDDLDIYIPNTSSSNRVSITAEGVMSSSPITWELGPKQWTKIGETSIDLSNYLAKDNTTSYTPSGDYNPATKKYVDEHGPVIPVYYYHGTFSSNITCALNEAGTFRVTINGYHSGNLNRTITINADGTDVASYQSNVIEVFSFMSVVSANTSLKISIDSTTAFTIHDVYIEKINVQSGYLTATVN